jgi:VWFA-related protein
MPRVAALLIGLAASLSAPGAFALQDRSLQQRPIFRTGVELVEVDVVVLDEHGRPVRGLTADDFTILDRREPRPVATFSEVAHAWAEDPDEPRPPRDARADVADNTTAQSERVVFLVIDDINIWVERVDLAKQMAHRVVDELGPEASMAVLFTSGKNSVEITQDRALLHDVIDAFQGAYHRFRVNGPCAPQSFQACQMLDQLEHVGKMAGAEDQRRKAIVLISEWQQVDTKGLFDVNQARSDPVPGSMAYMSGGDPEAFAAIPAWEPNYHEIELLQMMQAFRRANVAMYGIDPRGRLQTPEERSRESRGENPMLRMQDPVYWSQEGLIETAEASGGFAIVDTNDFEAGLDRILADLDNYYLLGFHPEDPGDESWHGLEVTVNRPGVTVRHRKGYQLGAEPEPPKNDDHLVQLSAGILPKTGLPLRLFATPVARAGNDARVAVTAEVRAPADRLERPGGRLEDTLTFTAIAVDMKRQKVEATAKHRVDVEVPRVRVRPDGDVTYQLVFGLDLRPGSYQLRVSAESARMDEAGSVYLTLDVPNVSDERVSIAGPAIGFAPGSRAAAGATLAEDGLLPRGFDPVLDRVFTAADTIRVRYEVWRRDTRGELPTRLEIATAAGEVVFARDAVVPDRGTEPFDIEVPLAGFAPGGYRVVVTAGAGERVARQELGFAVRRAR